jgi:hypothetical protein
LTFEGFENDLVCASGKIGKDTIPVRGWAQQLQHWFSSSANRAVRIVADRAQAVVSDNSVDSSRPVSPFPVREIKWRREAEVVAYSRKFPEQDRAIETVFSLMRQHPEGVTVNELNELIRAHEDKVRSEIAWFHSIDVLIDEGRVYTCAKWRERGYLESLKLYAK